MTAIRRGWESYERSDYDERETDSREPVAPFLQHVGGLEESENGSALGGAAAVAVALLRARRTELRSWIVTAAAFLFCLPIADKLHGKLLDEETNRTLIIDGILMIRDSKSPTLVREMLLAYLPEKHRDEEGEPVPA